MATGLNNMSVWTGCHNAKELVAVQFALYEKDESHSSVTVVCFALLQLQQGRDLH